MKSQNWKYLLGMASVSCMPFVGSATLYDAAADFSATSNPTGVWAYGWSQTLGSAFNLDTAKNPDLLGVSGVVQWQGNQPPGADGNPSVFENTTGSTVQVGSITMQANSLAFHPGSGGQYSVVQFTAPSAGDYLISATFQGDDSVGPTTTGVNVLVGGNSVFTSIIDGFGPSSAKSLGSTLVSLSQNETVDFTVVLNGKFDYDSTGLQASVTSVPEPTTMIAGALLLLPFGASTLRILRKRQVA